nr:RNA-directed DNA polymerase, eukaryota, reverse transcriptase zinc-binding domain protein [Tanacetum cinerariifolium]
VGDGSLIRFWDDTWVGDSPFRDHFNRLYHLEIFKYCLVGDRISTGSWSWDWLRPISSGRSHSDFIHMLDEIGTMDVGKVAILAFGLSQTMDTFLLAALAIISTTACFPPCLRVLGGSRLFLGRFLPEVVFEVREKFVLLLVRHSFRYDITYQIVAKSVNHGSSLVSISMRVSPGKVSSTLLSLLVSSFSI